MGISLIEFINSNQPATQGTFLVRRAANDARFNSRSPTIVRMEDYSGYADVMIPSGWDAGGQTLDDGVVVATLQKRDPLRHAPTIELANWSGANNPDEIVAAMPYTQCPAPSLLKTLVTIHRRVRTDCLSELLARVLTDHSILLPFISVPASRVDHHSEPGGLLRHSIEVCREAFLASRALGFKEHEIELVMITGLLHDIGKTSTHSITGHLTATGKQMSHELEGALILKTHLEPLRRVWPEARSFILRTINHRVPLYAQKNKPISVFEDIVRAADRISADADAGMRGKPISYFGSPCRELPNGRKFEDLGCPLVCRSSDPPHRML